MFKYVVFATLLALASAKPLLVEYPVVGYSAPVAAYTAPVEYSAYSAYSPIAYSTYTYPSSYNYYVR